MPIDFEEKVKRQVHTWFGNKLSDNVDLDDVWDRLDEIYEDTMVTGLAERAQKAGWDSGEDWWKKGGRTYSRHASEAFGTNLSRRGGKKKTKDNVDDAFDDTKKELESLIRAMRRKKKASKARAAKPASAGPAPEKVLAPVLCDDLAD